MNPRLKYIFLRAIREKVAIDAYFAGHITIEELHEHGVKFVPVLARTE